MIFLQVKHTMERMCVSRYQKSKHALSLAQLQIVTACMTRGWLNCFGLFGLYDVKDSPCVEDGSNCILKRVHI